MKKLLHLCLLTMLVVSAVGCDAFHTLTKRRKALAQGHPYELMVVCDQPKWKGAVGDTVRAALASPVMWLNQSEPHYNLIHVLERGFTGIMADHRNVMKLLVDPSVEKAEAAVAYDVNSSPQIVVTVQAPTEEALIGYISDHRAELVQVYEAAERDRAINVNNLYHEEEIEQTIFDTFGVWMKVPKGYMLAVHQPDFIWLRKEYASSGLGIVLYAYPYEGKESLSADTLLEKRNEFVSRIPGPLDGSYMTTAKILRPDYRMFRLENRLWCEQRGFWDVEGDYMGGPFISFSTLNKARKQVFTMDCYIYSPKLPKRNYLREMEHLLYQVQIPEK